MVRSSFAVAVVALLCSGLPAVAQEAGGVRLGHQGVLLDEVEQRAPNCPLSQTNVLVGVNKAIGGGAAAQQRLGAGGGTCRPLVSAQVVAGVNLATGSGSVADQSLTARSQPGLVATTNFGRGVNVAAGRGSAAMQRILGQIDR